MVPPPVSETVKRVPVPVAQISCAEIGDIEAADRVAFTVTVTSFEMIALPQVGVDVQTTYQVPTPKIEPVGKYVCPVAPDIGVIAPPDTERLPQVRAVIVPPPVSVTVRRVPVPVPQMVWSVIGAMLTAERLGVTV
jgi:hypothetical protein